MTTRQNCSCDEECSFPYLAFIPVISILTGMLVLILRSRRSAMLVEKPRRKTVELKAILLPEEAPASTPPKADDLTILEGIGPKVSAVLATAGIYRFEQLAQTKPEKIKEILLKAGNRISDPTTWPEQARLAAAGKWKELEKLTSQLKGGRRT